MSTAAPLKYLAGYPVGLLSQVRELIAEGRKADVLQRRYPPSTTRFSAMARCTTTCQR